MSLSSGLNSLFTMPQILELCLRIIVAALCGAAIGFERTWRFKEAGIRTHIIVCVASAMAMIVSKYGFADLGADGGLFGTHGTDPARIAAQVVSGISFLGAGVIFRHGGTVTGLTTAAGVWATAGIGLAVGAGMYWLGVFVAVLVALLQIMTHWFAVGGDAYASNHLHATVRTDERFREVLQTKLREWKAQTVESKVTRNADGSITYELTLMMPRSISTEELMELARNYDEIIEISGSNGM